MTTAHLTCDSYRNNILSGFVRLQEQQEFVDLTLAADGHLVKVHKSIIALASPYIKAMIQSASNHNPVIFLNNVCYDMLVYLLEYVYQGEVNVPQDKLESFLNVMKSLEITGFESAQSESDQNAEIVAAKTQLKNSVIMLDMTCEKTKEIERPSNIAACITINSDHNLEVKQFVKNGDESFQLMHKNNEHQQIITNADAFQGDMPMIDECENGIEYAPISDLEMNNDLVYDQHTLYKKHTNVTPTPANSIESRIDSETPVVYQPNPSLNFELDKEAADALRFITQYSVSERGAVQIIVSRYIYCSHHSSKGGRAHRWRCADYRKLRCPAYIDSLDNRIVLRKGAHKHGFHDDRIYNKNKRGLLFHSLKEAKKATELPEKNDSFDDDNEKAVKATESSNTNISYGDDNDIENAIQANSILNYVKPHI